MIAHWLSFFIMLQESTSLSCIATHFGDVVKKAIEQYFERTLQDITLAELATLPHISIETLFPDCSYNARTRILKACDFAAFMVKKDSDFREQLLKEYMCPITLDIPKIPFLSPCCGHVFERSAFVEHLRQGQDYCGNLCPLCRQYVLYSFALCSVGNVALKNTIDLLQQNNV